MLREEILQYHHKLNKFLKLQNNLKKIRAGLTA